MPYKSKRKERSCVSGNWFRAVRRWKGRTVREELAEHEGVVGFGVFLGQPDVLVHVEGDDVLEPGVRMRLVSIYRTHGGRHSRELALLDELDEVLVRRDGRGACGQPEHERLLGCRLEVVDPVHPSSTVSACFLRCGAKRHGGAGGRTAWRCSCQCTLRRRTRRRG